MRYSFVGQQYDFSVREACVGIQPGNLLANLLHEEINKDFRKINHLEKEK